MQVLMQVDIQKRWKLMLLYQVKKVLLYQLALLLQTLC